MTPAERLREAAARLREVADAATPGPWEADRRGGVTGRFEGMTEVISESTDQVHAAYIAMMSPPVALALADWMDSTAHDAQHVHDPIYNLTSTTVSRALLVADAVLGGEQS